MDKRFGPTRRAVGGIKAQTQRGRAVADTWWGRRWIEVLESFDIGARLQRGRSYARQGQVLAISISAGAVAAKVQGSRSQPYEVTITMSVLTDEDWQRVIQAFAVQALYSAKLLARQMPPQVEDVFSAQGLSLFPATQDDLHTSCSCPDWSNPCKHIAAVFYLMGEEFDRDPFLIFGVRGLSEERLMSALDLLLASQTKKRSKKSKRGDTAIIVRAAGSVSGAPGDFWRCGPLADDQGDLRVPQSTAALARNLGKFPFWRGHADFWGKLEETYKRASAETLKLLSE